MNKYRNKKVQVDMYVFDSIRESQRYKELKLLERAEKIKELKLQPRFLLQDSLEKMQSVEEDNWDTKKHIESEIEQDMIRESKILNKRIRELIK